MKSARIVSAGALALALSACANMGKIAPQSHMIDPAQLGAGKAIGQAARAIEWPKQQWWQDLHDPQLNRLLAVALQDSPTLHAAQARVRMANALAEGAEENTKPTTTATMSLNRELYSKNGSTPPPLAGNYAWRNQATVTSSFDLDLWGHNRQALAAALDDVELASAESQMARLSLEAALVKTYIKLSHQFEVQDLLQSTLAQRQRILDISRKRLRAGLATELDVAQFETAIPATRRQLEQAASAITLLRNELAALQGKGPEAGETIARPTLKLSAVPALPSALPAELVGRRPDIAAQRWRVEGEAKRIKVSKATFYPNINLVAFAGLQAFGFSNFLQSGSQVRGIAPAVSLPIFEGARLRAQLGVQTAIYDVAVDQYNATVVHALSDVAGAVETLQSLGKQHALAGQALGTASKTSKLAQRAYRSGLTDTMNVLTAEVELLSQQQQMANLYALQLDGYVGLMVALGGGTEIAQIATQPPTI